MNDFKFYLTTIYKEDGKLSDWVNQQPLAEKITCLGDGHDGVWNVVAEIATHQERREILDWYHLKAWYFGIKLF